MKLSFFRTLSVRSKIMTIAVLGLLLAGTSIFAVLYSTGKLGTKASTIVKTVTFSGTVTDSMTQKPISGAAITSGYIDGPASSTTTDAKGNYKISITVDTSKPDQQLAGVKVSKKEYTSGENDSVEINLSGSITSLNAAATTSLNPSSGSTVTSNPANQAPISPVTLIQNTSSATSLNQNFSLVSNDTFHGVDQSLGADLPATTYDETGNPCEIKSYYYEYVEGVLFCTAPRLKDKFITNRSLITKNAKQANYIKSQVGFPTMPKIFLTERVYYSKSAPGATSLFDPTSGRYFDPEITLTYDWLDELNGITHELGHFVDYYRGYDGVPIFTRAFRGGFCVYKDDQEWAIRCYSSAKTDFGSAYKLAKNNAVTGYANTNRLEMYAEFFSAQMYYDKELPTKNRLRDSIENYMLLDNNLVSTINFTSGSSLVKAGSTTGHNAIMYLYKYVAKQSNMDEVFPGTIERWTYSKIRDGLYMNVGVVSVKVSDHGGDGMGSTSVSLDKSSQVTREHSDFLFKLIGLKTKGTLVSLSAPVGSQKTFDIPTAPDYYKGAIYNPIKKDIIQGSNPVVKLSYFPLYFTITGNPTIGTKGKLFFPPTGRTAYSIAKSQMSRYPDFGTKNGAVDTITFGRGQLVMMVGGDIQTGSGSKMQVTSTFTGSGTFISGPYPGPAMSIISITPGKTCTINNAKYPITGSCK